MPAQGLIGLLNPKIRGWWLYHRSVVSRKTFEQVDHEIFKTLWAWAIRLHKNKGKKWINKRYWHTLENRRWMFASEGINRKGKKVIYYLFKATDVNIKRHVKIMNNANPYDLEWEMYFERRAFVFYKLKSTQFIIEKVPTLKVATLKLLSKRGPLY